MTTKLKDEQFQAGVVANLILGATIQTVTPTNSSWVALGSNLTANTIGYIEIYGGVFGEQDRVVLDLKYIASAVQSPNVNYIRATLPSNVPAGTYDLYIVKPSGRYSVKTAALTFE